MRMDITVLYVRVLTIKNGEVVGSRGVLGLEFTIDNEEMLIERYRYVCPLR